MSLKTIAQIISAIKTILGITHKGIVKVEGVLGEFDKMIEQLNAAVSTIDNATATNTAVISAKVAENAALVAKRSQAVTVAKNLAALTGK